MNKHLRYKSTDDVKGGDQTGSRQRSLSVSRLPSHQQYSSNYQQYGSSHHQYSSLPKWKDSYTSSLRPKFEGSYTSSLRPSRQEAYYSSLMPSRQEAYYSSLRSTKEKGYTSNFGTRREETSNVQNNPILSHGINHAPNKYTRERG